MKLPNNSSKGFTLIELMVAIAIVAILATIGIIAFGSTQDAARDAKTRQDVEDIKKAMFLSRTASGDFCLGVPTCVISIWVNSTGYNPGDQQTAVTSLKGYLKNQNPLTDPLVGVRVQNKDHFIVLTALKKPPSSTCSELSSAAGWGFGNTMNYCITE